MLAERARLPAVARRRGVLAVPLATSKLAGVEMAPADPILGVSEAFRRSTDPNKLNLGVGAYRTEELQPLVLDVVRKAETKILQDASLNHEYLPIEGLGSFRTATVQLLLGEDHPALREGRVATLQALSGTGSLRVGAAFIARWLPQGTKVLLSNPTWGNHRNIFSDEGVSWQYYRYFDADTVALDFVGMTADLEAAADGSVVLLHGCAHNPTGIDPTPAQWQTIGDICKRKGHLPFFDVAYQGFATGSLDADAAAPRMFLDMGLEIFVAQSYSKNLDGERVGAINAIVNDDETAARVLSQMKRIARALWSNPPTHGARIAATVVGDPTLFAEWKQEMAGMADRIDKVRKELRAALEMRMPNKNWSFITEQIGMFTFTGLPPEIVDRLTNKHAVFMTRDGRISMAGLASSKVNYLADAIVESISNA